MKEIPKELKKHLLDFAKKYEPLREINPNYKESGCHQTCPNGFDTYNSDWFVSKNGDMCNRCSDYFIESKRLKEDDWILHCMGKRWFDANTFIPAYFEACRRAGIKTVTMRIYYFKTTT